MVTPPKWKAKLVQFLHHFKAYKLQFHDH